MAAGKTARLIWDDLANVLDFIIFPEFIVIFESTGGFDCESV